MKVVYENEIWDAHLFLRESLFEPYQRCSPDAIIKITQTITMVKVKDEAQATSTRTKYVPIRQLQLYSIWRNEQSRKTFRRR